jgi:hypothetical protein
MPKESYYYYKQLPAGCRDEKMKQGYIKPKNEREQNHSPNYDAITISSGADMCGRAWTLLGSRKNLKPRVREMLDAKRAARREAAVSNFQSTLC